MLTVKRGKLAYIGNQTRLQQCSCTPVLGEPVDMLLAIAGGVPDDTGGATDRLRQDFPHGTCVELVGHTEVKDDLPTFYLNIAAQPNLAIEFCSLHAAEAESQQTCR